MTGTDTEQGKKSDFASGAELLLCTRRNTGTRGVAAGVNPAWDEVFKSTVDSGRRAQKLRR